MPRDFGHNVRMVHAFRQGEHICSIHDTEEEQLATAAAYLADGIWRGERGLYVGADRDAVLQRFRAALPQPDSTPPRWWRVARCIELTHADAYLARRPVRCERMLTMLNESDRTGNRRRVLGLARVRRHVVAPAGAPGSDEVGEYEALLNQFFAGARACALCQYNRQRAAGALDRHGADHALHGGRRRPAKFNPFFQPDRSATPAD